MRVAIISDIHGNLQAFEAVLHAIDESACEGMWCLDAQTHRVCLIGHSHVALSFCRVPGEAASGQTREDGEELDLAQGEWLVNPGSVGQPRDGDPRAAWLELDLDGAAAVYHRVEYD